MIEKLKVRAESLPARCEICHQTDCFEPQTNYCSRCSSVAKISSNNVIQVARKAPTLTQVELGIAVGMFLGIFLGISCAAMIGYWTGAVVFIFSYTLMACLGIHGAIVGAILGRSLHDTDGASGATAPKVVSGAISNLKNRKGLKLFEGATSGALTGLAIFLPLLAIIILFNGSLSFSWSGWLRIAIGSMLPMINGAVIGLLCKNRSDRRRQLAS